MIKDYIYFKEMAAQLDYDVEWIGPLPLLRYSGMLEEGEIDGALGFHKNKITETFLHFFDEPLFYAQPTLIVREDNSLNLHSRGKILYPIQYR